MKIAIAYPPIDTGKGVPLLSQNRQFQWFNSPTYIYPVVPASAATLLKKNGYEVLWSDGIAEEKSYGEWLSEIKKEQPDVLVIETKTPVVKTHWKIIEDLKNNGNHGWNLVTVLIGDHVTALPQESMENSHVDFVITGGDYDFSLLSLCEHLSKGKELDAGIWYRSAGLIKNTGPFVLKGDLNKLPFIDRDLTKWYLYSEKNGNYKKLPGTYTMAGRDCWYHKCTFCSWPTIYPSFRARKPENLLDEIGILIDKYGVKEVMDDSGTFPAGQWLEEFCRGMIERGYNKRISIDCNMRFGALSPEQYGLMREAGFRLLLFGIESANPKTLERLNKGVTVETIVSSCKDARCAGLYPHITIMFGYPWEAYQDALNTLNLGKWLLKKGYAWTMQATVVIPYPGTPLFEECKAAGWLATTDWERYDMREAVMKTTMSSEQITNFVQTIYSTAFSPEFLLRRFLAIRDLDDIKYFIRAGGKVLGHIFDFRSRGN